MSSKARRSVQTVLNAFIAAVNRLDKSLSPSITLAKVQSHHFTFSEIVVYGFQLVLASLWLYLLPLPILFKLLLPILYTSALLVPFTSQFFLPATPIFSYLLAFFSCRFIPSPYRPTPSVSLLPTLESVLYGANISDILTRFTHPILDILAWFPYGVGHYIVPFVVAAFLWLFRPKEALHLWARLLGFFNLTGVIIQILFPCAAPWYELIYGLTPASYSTKGSPGGLIRIDALFHSNGYTTAFTNSPLVFGAFPSLHAGCATLEALFISHFFPQTTKWVWTYAGVLYWATMYLTHHYLIDVVGGGCLAMGFFYFFLPDEFKNPVAATAPPGTQIGNPVALNALAASGTTGASLPAYRMGTQRSKYEIYDLEQPPSPVGGPLNGGRRRDRSMMADAAAAYELEQSDSEAEDGDIGIAYRSTSGTKSGKDKSSAPITESGASNTGRPNAESSARRGGHRHTASIARLIRGEDSRAPEEGAGWSPIHTPVSTPRRGEFSS
ncbi:PAP2-domain-containing protein [Dendrothele bispora CBS 962.96]|uniref:PAP2-domain-containing protein n=1 Tax=Dendrothele bispora (strain CBS 962.96) TaxID=1314807 RepID=A0A4S8LRN6_DENBC|nr:PAP2-domain-containing protein [Dendrothele bispora CBS 962.96]